MNYWELYWLNLHWLSFNYPINPTNNEKSQIVLLINNMKIKGIQCYKCRKSFNNYLQNKDLNEIVKNRDNLFYFFWDCHNDVNKKINKKILSLKEAYSIFETKNWGNELNKYVDILSLFKDNRLDKFPNLLSESYSRGLVENKNKNKNKNNFINKLKKKITSYFHK